MSVKDPAISVERLVVTRGGRTVLPDLSCTIETGSVTGLLGPSGGGKTTLIRAIVGVQKIKSGQVTVLGLPAGSPALRAKVGYVTQTPSVYADLTIADNIRYFARVQGATSKAGAQAIADVGLQGRERDLVARLSNGQRARVSLACALLADPQVLVLDEPTVGLDPVLRRDLWQLFHQLAAHGRTLLVSSHVMDEADRCDRLLLLRDGILVADDSPTGLRGHTQTQNLEEAFLRIASELAPEVPA